jgi:signal transduction histidine kinase/AmiR/NasT family two-component response regulator
VFSQVKLDRGRIVLQTYVGRYREVFRVRLVTNAGLALAVAFTFSIVTAIEYLVSSYAIFALYIWAVETAARRLDDPGAAPRLKRQSTILDFLVSCPGIWLALHVGAAAPLLHTECQVLLVTLVVLAGMQVHLTYAGLVVSIVPPLVALMVISRPDVPAGMVAAHLCAAALFTGSVLAASWRQQRSDRNSAEEAAEFAAMNIELQAAVTEAQAQDARAQMANRAKSEFLATISHEIRTPLNGVMGMAQVMEQAPLSRDQRGRLTVIQASARDLLEVVNAVLDISKIEAGKMDLAPTVFGLDGFVEAIERLYGPLAHERGLALTIEVDPAARGWRRGDEVRLRQVLSNLISNAVKFTEVGSIHVRVTGDAERLLVSVADTGVGIPAELRERIFETFVQADGSTTRRTGGAGLGLAICREILNLLGGAISFETESGVGTHFAFNVPFPSVEAPPRTQSTSAGRTEADGHELRLLVVDDNSTNRAVLQAMLSPLGAYIETACQGREALAAWEAGRWNAILMDVHMPEMDGLEASRSIRAREAATGRTRTPIIAVTASVLTHETEAYFNAGMDDVIAKPIEFQRLITSLDLALAPLASEPKAARNGLTDASPAA